MICLAAPPAFGSVGEWYENFDQTTDDEVIELLERARREIKDPTGAGANP